MTMPFDYRPLSQPQWTLVLAALNYEVSLAWTGEMSSLERLPPDVSVQGLHALYDEYFIAVDVFSAPTPGGKSYYLFGVHKEGLRYAISDNIGARALSGEFVLNPFIAELAQARTLPEVLAAKHSKQRFVRYGLAVVFGIIGSVIFEGSLAGFSVRNIAGGFCVLILLGLVFDAEVLTPRRHLRTHTRITATARKLGYA
jgi:hypothetical protein